MATALQVTTQAGEIERVLLEGDLSRLTETQRLSYYNQVCTSLGLNPLTKPFSYIKLNGKLVLYALKDATEQLRKLHGVSITAVTSQRIDDVFVVTANAADRSGRTDAATGAVAIANLKGEALANALMKAETKAKRRATLSICGLGMLDETETDTIPAPILPPAPKLAVPLQADTVQIVGVTVMQWGGEVTVIDNFGVETTHKTAERQLAELCEQIQQEGVPVTLEFQAITRGVNKGKEKLVAVHRHGKVKEENAVLDAQIAASEGVL